MKTGLFFIPLAGLLLANAAQAAVCQNVNGAPTTVDYDLSTTLTAAQKRGGEYGSVDQKPGSERSGRVSRWIGILEPDVSFLCFTLRRG
ncbi:fimbrial protein BcfD [Klebsiella oxytoca]|nr:fimbrial protein BcfD [Klebsiella oxytoca]